MTPKMRTIIVLLILVIAVIVAWSNRSWILNKVKAVAPVAGA